MAVFRVNKNRNYSVMSNYHFKDKNLSLKAVGLLSLMLSLPDNWNYSIAGLVALKTDGESSVRSALSELEEHGYLVRKRVRKGGKLDGVEYNIYETPQKVKPLDLPNVENPQQENLILENQGQLNTNNIKYLNNKVLNNNIKAHGSQDIEIAEEIINYLNSKTETHYKATTTKTIKLISNLLADGFTVDDFKTVIDNKCADWLNDEKMYKYLRPMTLFGDKFENYLNAKPKPTSDNSNLWEVPDYLRDKE